MDDTFHGKALHKQGVTEISFADSVVQARQFSKNKVSINSSVQQAPSTKLPEALLFLAPVDPIGALKQSSGTRDTPTRRCNSGICLAFSLRDSALSVTADQNLTVHKLY